MTQFDPRAIAALAVDEMIKEGATKHFPDSWQSEEPSMHIQKAARHAQSAGLLLDHPKYTQDEETTIDHLKRTICRASFALAILLALSSCSCHEINYCIPWNADTNRFA